MDILIFLVYLMIALAFVDAHQAHGAKKIRTYLLSFIWPYCVGRWVANRVEKELMHEIEDVDKENTEA